MSPAAPGIELEGAHAAGASRSIQFALDVTGS
jgi:hypothetical protein